MSNQSNQSGLEVVGTRTIDQIRNDGIDKQLKEMIAAERQEMQRIKDQAKERLSGQFISLRQDKELRTFLFSGNYQKVQMPAKDFITKQEIPGKTTTRYRFQIYDLTTFDSNKSLEPAIWERGMNEADQVLYWWEKGVMELSIIRNGGPNSKSTLYNIFPANR